MKKKSMLCKVLLAVCLCAATIGVQAQDEPTAPSKTYGEASVTAEDGGEDPFFTDMGYQVLMNGNNAGDTEADWAVEYGEEAERELMIYITEAKVDEVKIRQMNYLASPESPFIFQVNGELVTDKPVAVGIKDGEAQIEILVRLKPEWDYGTLKEQDLVEHILQVVVGDEVWFGINAKFRIAGLLTPELNFPTEGNEWYNAELSAQNGSFYYDMGQAVEGKQLEPVSLVLTGTDLGEQVVFYSLADASAYEIDCTAEFELTGNQLTIMTEDGVLNDVELTFTLKDDHGITDFMNAHAETWMWAADNTRMFTVAFTPAGPSGPLFELKGIDAVQGEPNAFLAEFPAVNVMEGADQETIQATITDVMLTLYNQVDVNEVTITRESGEASLFRFYSAGMKADTVVKSEAEKLQVEYSILVLGGRLNENLTLSVDASLANFELGQEYAETWLMKAGNETKRITVKLTPYALAMHISGEDERFVLDETTGMGTLNLDKIAYGTAETYALTFDVKGAPATEMYIDLNPLVGVFEGKAEDYEVANNMITILLPETGQLNFTLQLTLNPQYAPTILLENKYNGFFSVNCGAAFTGISVLFEATGVPTGVENATLEGIRFDGRVVINPENRALSVYNAAGMLVVEGTADLDLTACPSGLYIVKSDNASMKVLK